MSLSRSNGLVISVIYFIKVLLFCNYSLAQSTLVLDSVSVTPDNRHIVLGWTLTTSVTEGYIEIHRQLPNGLYSPIARVPLSQNSFIDTGVNARHGSWAYYIVARAPNGDNIAVSVEAHRSIFQHPPVLDVCQRIIRISWDGYSVTTSHGYPVPLPLPFTSVEVVTLLNDTLYSKDTLYIRMPESFNLSLQQEGRYEILVTYQNRETGISSSANRQTIDVVFNPRHEFMHIRGVTFDQFSSATNIIIHAGTYVAGGKYVLHRHDPVTGKYYPVDTNYVQSGTFMFTDLGSKADQRSEVYIVKAIDGCGFINIKSNPIGTIFLEVENFAPSAVRLSWSEYLGWQYGLSEYQVLRSDENGQFEIIAVLSPSTTSFYDNNLLQARGAVAQPVRYRVRAIEAPGSAFGFRDTVYSNTVKLPLNYEVFIPNAINVSSHVTQNRVFLPVFSQFVPQNYSLIVFNRWGQRVFASTDPSVGWSGHTSGGDAPEGVYTYVIEFSDHEGNMTKKTGVFLLLR